METVRRAPLRFRPDPWIPVIGWRLMSVVVVQRRWRARGDGAVREIANYLMRANTVSWWPRPRGGPVGRGGRRCSANERIQSARDPGDTGADSAPVSMLQGAVRRRGRAFRRPTPDGEWWSMAEHPGSGAGPGLAVMAGCASIVWSLSRGRSRIAAAGMLACAAASRTTVMRRFMGALFIALVCASIASGQQPQARGADGAGAGPFT